MPDDSHLDDRYFIDRYKYNCPFCNRGHVSYHITGRVVFDWTPNKTCYAYFARCNSCGKKSMHLTYDDLGLMDLRSPRARAYGATAGYRFSEDVEDIDSRIFYSVPTSFFTLDSRIPRVLRDQFTEAEGCLKGNFLTGASACARKLVYEMARLEDAEGDDYEERIKSLKGIHDDVDPTYFDTLTTIQEVTSDKVHEDAYDGWESGHLRLILATLHEILHDVYVEPEVRKERREEILALRKDVLEEGSEGQAAAEAAAAPASDQTES